MLVRRVPPGDVADRAERGDEQRGRPAGRHGLLVYSVFGLLIFAGLTMADFQRLRRSRASGLAAPL